MDNYQVADHFALLAKLMDIHGENSFKAKSYATAAYTIEKLPVQVTAMNPQQLFATRGIGDSTGKKILEILETGQLQALNDIMSKTPPGILEMMSIKGLGPKKIATIWRELEVESIGELLYACNENRLTLYKGFGAKTQQNVKDAIEFYLGNKGSFLYSQVEAALPPLQALLEKALAPAPVYVTGAYRRQVEVIDLLEFVVEQDIAAIKTAVNEALSTEPVEETPGYLVYRTEPGLKIKLYAAKEDAARHLFTTTCSPAFADAFAAAYPQFDYNDITAEAGIFEKAGLAFVPPCLRDNDRMVTLAQQGKLPELITPADIKGIIHSHSNWSDGVHTIEQMADACIAKGLEYLVISDHSKSAFYANGLSEERIHQQHLYVDELNNRYEKAGHNFRIFKSIECDILNDGSLDYSDNILSTFDLVIASVHSNLKMSEEKAMMRLINAIENPYTMILGHMTGRLLLSRNGYPVDHKKIIDACAANMVVVELNAHPSRLDIDWRQIDYALEKGVLISIDPDAHSTDGFDDTRYGVLVAQKAGVTKAHNLSSFSLADFEDWLMYTRSQKM